MTLQRRFARVVAMFGKDHSRLVRFASVNGLPGFVSIEADGHLQTTALDLRDGRIATIYVTRNPDKLRHWPAPTSDENALSLQAQPSFRRKREARATDMPLTPDPRLCGVAAYPIKSCLSRGDRDGRAGRGL